MLKRWRPAVLQLIVTPEFRKSVKIAAAMRGVTMTELTIAALEAALNQKAE